MPQGQASAARGWTVTFAALGINLVLGLLYAWGDVAKALQADPWGWTSTQASLPFTFATVSFAIMMVFAGRLQDRVGPRPTVMLGGLMLGLGLIASSFTSSPAMMLLTYGVIGGIGIGLGYSATTPPAIKWFPPARKGLIAGIVVSGVGLASVYVAPLTQYLLKSGGVQQTLLCLGIGTIVGVCVLALLLRNPPAGYIPPMIGASTARKAPVAHRDLDWNVCCGPRSSGCSGRPSCSPRPPDSRSLLTHPRSPPCRPAWRGASSRS
jgi:OFA family oxalate/formate antiporter-like MFS transporter